MTTTNLSVDNTAMLIGIQTYGVGFEDATFFQNYGATPKNQAAPVSLHSECGPLSGGTASVPYGFFDLIPDVWYGPNRGTASLESSNTLTVLSPPGNADGPVNLKYIYPNGQQAFTPQAFSYSAYPQYSILSGATPSGGVPGRISGYGMPADASGGTLTIGNNTATITTKVGQYPPYTGEAFPSTYLDFTIPAGNPGYADLAISTPIGNGTLPKAVFYAKSVTDYSTPDTATDVLYDPARQQVYLSGTDHIDVFSLASKQWLKPLKPATLGSQSQFRGLALTPDSTPTARSQHPRQFSRGHQPRCPLRRHSPSLSPLPYQAAPVAERDRMPSQPWPAIVHSFPVGFPPALEVAVQRDSLLRQPCVAHRDRRRLVPTPERQRMRRQGSTNEATSDGTLAIVAAEEGGSCLYSSTSNSFALVNNDAHRLPGVALSGDGNIAASRQWIQRSLRERCRKPCSAASAVPGNDRHTVSLEQLPAEHAATSTVERVRKLVLLGLPQLV